VAGWARSAEYQDICIIDYTRVDIKKTNSKINPIESRQVK